MTPLALFLVAGVAHAGGLNLENGRYSGPVITFELTAAQKNVIDRYRDCQLEHPNTLNAYTSYIFKLTASQTRALVARKGFSPRVFALYETYRELNDAGPRWNVVLRFSEDEIEVPLDLVVADYQARAAADEQRRDVFNPCFPELLAP